MVVNCFHVLSVSPRHYIGTCGCWISSAYLEPAYPHLRRLSIPLARAMSSDTIVVRRLTRPTGECGPVRLQFDLLQ
jgi:hypothetical protein